MNTVVNNIRAADFRTFYANMFRFTFSGNEVQVTYGIQINPGTEDTSMDEQTSVVLSHPAAKTLAQILTRAIADYEEASGAEIKLEPSKLKGFEDILAANKAARKAATPT